MKQSRFGLEDCAKGSKFGGFSLQLTGHSLASGIMESQNVTELVGQDCRIEALGVEFAGFSSASS